MVGHSGEFFTVEQSGCAAIARRITIRIVFPIQRDRNGGGFLRVRLQAAEPADNNPERVALFVNEGFRGD